MLIRLALHDRLHRRTSATTGAIIRRSLPQSTGVGQHTEPSARHYCYSTVRRSYDGIDWPVSGTQVNPVLNVPPDGDPLACGPSSGGTFNNRVGKSMQSIAAELGRATSTISRELRRNLDPASGGYLPHTAHRLAAVRRQRPKTTRIAADPVLREFVDGRLAKRHSPEQIIHELTVEFPDSPSRQLAVETLYQAIYQPGRNGLTSTARVSLRSGRGRRRPLRYQRRRPGHLLPEVMIDARPEEANDRVQPGHLEGDLIIGRNGGTAIGTIVERTTRFLILVHLPRRRTAAEMTHALGIASPFVAPFPDLGSREGTGRAPPHYGHDRHPGILLPRPFTMGTWLQREYERAAPTILPQRHRPFRSQRRKAR